MIYGAQNVYGENALVCIGQTCGRCFGIRIPEHEEWLDWDHPDFKIYVGRTGASLPVSKEDRDAQIDYSEKLLISYCQPMYNVKEKDSYDKHIPDDIVILNFGDINLH